MNRDSERGAIVYPNRRADTLVKLSPGDWIKLGIFMFGLIGTGVAGWYGLKADVHSLRQDVTYTKERDDRQDKENERTRTEMLQALKDINEKLDNPRFRR